MSDEVLKIGFDVDGTLIHDGSPEFLDNDQVPLDGVPRWSIINLYKAFELLGADLYIWSSEGKDHAEFARKILGLNGTAMAKDKDFGMDIAVDNKDTDFAKVTIKV